MIYLEEESGKKAEIEAENQNAIISNDMAKLKDQCDAIKRAIIMMELAESKKDLAML